MPLPDGAEFFSFCQGLYDENIDYGALPSDRVERVGTHTSIVLHNFQGGLGRWASIHYRENLELLTNGQLGQIAMAAAFLRNLGADLHLLAERLRRGLRDVGTIYGLTHLSPSWGRRHAFTTVEYTSDPEKVRTHLKAIKGLPPEINGRTLTLFASEREAFIREFHSAPIPDRLDSK